MENEVKKERFSYINQYRPIIEDLASKGVNVASIVRYLRSTTGLEIPFTTIHNYMKRNGIEYIK